MDTITEMEPGDGLTDAQSAYKRHGGWIPVSERLPEAGTRCFVTHKPTVEPYAAEAIFKEGMFYWPETDEDGNYTLVDYPVAWMPLPPPYRP